MGRGHGEHTQQAVIASPRGLARRSATQRRVTTAELLAANRQSAAATVVMNSGEMVDAPENAKLLAQGLADVSDVSSAGGRYTVKFHDGTTAIVDLDRMAVALSTGDQASDVQINGALAAAIAYQARMDMRTTDPLRQEIGDIHDEFDRNLNGDHDPSVLAELAEKIAEDLKRRPDTVTVNPPDLHRQLPQRRRGLPLPTSRRQREQMMLAQARLKLSEAYRKFGPEHAGRALIFPIDPATGRYVGGRYIGVTDEDLERRRQVAVEHFGGEDAIPRSGLVVNPDGSTEGMFDLSPQDIEAFQRLGGRILAGQRFFDLIGPPGSGKDTWVREVAAHLGYPMAVFNIGPTYELEDALGGHGLKAVKVTNQTTGEEEVVTGSVTAVGPLARALQTECIVVIQEPEGQMEDLVRMHGLFGDSIGPKSEDENPRLGTISSPTGNTTFQAHPGNLVFITRNPQADEDSMREATMDRAGHFDFEYRDPDVEARRIARMTRFVMENQSLIPEDSLLFKREWTAEDLKPMVEIMERFRELHEEKPHEILDVPGARKAVEVYSFMLLSAYGGDPVAHDSTKMLFSGYLPPSDVMDRDTRDSLLVNEIYSSNANKKLREMADFVNAVGHIERGEPLEQRHFYGLLKSGMDWRDLLTEAGVDWKQAIAEAGLSLDDEGELVRRDGTRL